MARLDDATLGFDADDYVHGSCPACCCPLDERYDCPRCEPRVDLEDSPVRATFHVETANGAVTWSGWCAFELPPPPPPGPTLVERMLDLMRAS